jgi:predicted N-acetyltransferase YhbS
MIFRRQVPLTVRRWTDAPGIGQDQAMRRTEERRPLPDGLFLRPAQPGDLDQLATLLAERGVAADAIDHRLIVDDPDSGLESCAVVVDGDRVVSTATLLDETLVLSGRPIPAGQVELVATDREYEGRGLVRALMGWAHERSDQRGHLAQIMIGIPYFYRQFGYQYAIAMPHSRGVHTVPPMPAEYCVRPAGEADMPAMARLQDAAQRGYDLWMPHSAACWRWLLARTGSSQLVVERAGRAVGTGRITPPDEGVVLGEVAAGEPPAEEALLAYAAGLSGTGDLSVRERGGALAAYLAPRPSAANMYYARVPDVAALLDHLRPVLSGRLTEAGLAADTGEIVLSFFRHHVRLDYRDGLVTGVRTGGPMQAPGAAGGAGLAPDLVAALLFGPHGITGLAERHPDVYPGPNEAVMRALFPPVRADLLTLYLP